MANASGSLSAYHVQSRQSTDPCKRRNSSINELDEINNSVRGLESPDTNMSFPASLSHWWAALVFCRCRDPVILDHGAPQIREVGNVVNRASAPLIRGPSSQGPHHIEGRNPGTPSQRGALDPLGLDPCHPALVRPGRSGKPDCPLSSVNPGEDWQGNHGADLPDNRPLRIRLGSDFSLATGATGITPQGQATGAG